MSRNTLRISDSTNAEILIQSGLPNINSECRNILQSGLLENLTKLFGWKKHILVNSMYQGQFCDLTL